MLENVYEHQAKIQQWAKRKKKSIIVKKNSPKQERNFLNKYDKL